MPEPRKPGPLQHQSNRYLRMAQDCGADIASLENAVRFPSDADSAAPFNSARADFDLAKARLGLCPGAEYGPAKRWPYFKELAERIGMPVVILGSRNDRQAAAGIHGKDLAGRTTLDEAIELIAGAAVVVSNDSGLMHVAAALRRPQVALFGSSSPEHTPPASANARVLWLRLECSPCYARECPLGHFRCMKEMGVEQVLAETRLL
jgi:heptosyltransferase II